VRFELGVQLVVTTAGRSAVKSAVKSAVRFVHAAALYVDTLHPLGVGCLQPAILSRRARDPSLRSASRLGMPGLWNDVCFSSRSCRSAGSRWFVASCWTG